MERTAALLAAVLLAACAGRASQTKAPGAKPPGAPGALTGRPVDHVTLADVGLDPDKMDRSADPCDDFYRFACGGWIDKAEIPEGLPVWGPPLELEKRTHEILHEILEQARKDPGGDPAMQRLGEYYGACMDEAAVEKAGLKPLARLLRVAGKVRDVPSLAAAIAELHRHGISVLFDVDAVPDRKDPGKLIADIDQSGLGLPGRDYYLKDDAQTKKIRDEYQAHVARTFELLGTRAPAARRDAAAVVAIERALARAQIDDAQEHDPTATDHRIDRAGLVKAAPAFGWDAYFRALGQPDITDINVHSVAYIEALGVMLTSFRPAAWRRYLTYHIIDAVASYLPRRFVDEDFRMIRALTGRKEPPPRWRRCVGAVNEDLPDLVAQPFVARVLGPDGKAGAADLVAALVKALGRAIDGEAWMDADTQRKAQEKLAKLRLMVGYPERWRKVDFRIGRGALLANHLAALQSATALRMNRIGQPPARDEAPSPPQGVNAYYAPWRNELVVLAGILQRPYFDKHASVAVNLGGLALLAGNQLTHGFDDQGARTDGDGRLAPWWSDDVSTRFNDRAQCVADFYGHYEAAPGVKVDGQLTRRENVADLAGVKLAFSAYRYLRRNAPRQQVADGFNEDQQFFLGLGQAWCFKVTEGYAREAAAVNPHAPPRFRIEGSLSNLREFAAAFQCKPGSKMRPAKTCEVW